jgi:GTP-binding protein
VDRRLAPQQIDLEFLEWLGEQAVPFSIVFTKGDKQSTSQLNANVMAYKKKLIETWETLPPIFVTSAEKGVGKDDILNYIESINAQIENV